jgi:hypothetical protein
VTVERWALGADRVTSRSRTTARSTPPTATTCPRRCSSRATPCCSTPAARGPRRRRRGLRLRRDHRHRAAVPRAPRRRRGARALDPRRLALLRRRQPPARTRASASSPSWRCRGSRSSTTTGATTSRPPTAGTTWSSPSRPTRGSPASRNLFTVDHFRAAVQSLTPDGIFVQWVQLYEMSPDNIKTHLPHLRGGVPLRAGVRGRRVQLRHHHARELSPHPARPGEPSTGA